MAEYYYQLHEDKYEEAIANPETKKQARRADLLKSVQSNDLYAGEFRQKIVEWESIWSSNED